MSASRFARSLAVSGLLFATAAAPAFAQGSKQHGDQCFLSSNVNNFSAPDDHTVYLRVGVNEIWKLGLMNDCLELPWRLSIGLQATPGDPWICHPIDATIISRGAGPHRCPVISMHHLTPDEVAALPKGVKP
jgi:hypothetical protein